MALNSFMMFVHLVIMQKSTKLQLRNKFIGTIKGKKI